MALVPSIITTYLTTLNSPPPWTDLSYSFQSSAQAAGPSCIGSTSSRHQRGHAAERPWTCHLYWALVLNPGSWSLRWTTGQVVCREGIDGVAWHWQLIRFLQLQFSQDLFLTSFTCGPCFGVCYSYTIALIKKRVFELLNEINGAKIMKAVIGFELGAPCSVSECFINWSI